MGSSIITFHVEFEGSPVLPVNENRWVEELRTLSGKIKKVSFFELKLFLTVIDERKNSSKSFIINSFILIVKPYITSSIPYHRQFLKAKLCWNRHNPLSNIFLYRRSQFHDIDVTKDQCRVLDIDSDVIECLCHHRLAFTCNFIWVMTSSCLAI
jgi:hypothetical protein